MKVKKKSDKSGMIPGSFVYVGKNQESTPIQIELIEYNQTHLEKKFVSSIHDCKDSLNNQYTSWVNIDGVHDIKLIEELSQTFKIHPLIAEDILNTDQRPKVEINNDYIYIVLKMISYDEKNQTFVNEQLSIILLDNLVITTQELPGDLFNNIRERIIQQKGRIRKLKADYLVYCIIDAIVDEYFKVIDRLESELEEIEADIENSKNSIQDIHWLKKEILYIRRAVYPVRDIISSLMREEHPFIQEKTSLYLRDIHDHCLQVYESVEIIRDIVSSLVEIHLSSVSNKMNEVMKVLTIFASIFIPLTFITGIYGMNFENMPELKWEYGYFYLWGLLLFITVSLMIYFKKKKWI